MKKEYKSTSGYLFKMYKNFCIKNRCSFYVPEDDILNVMNYSAFCSLNKSGDPKKQKLYDKYNGCYDDYVYRIMVKVFRCNDLRESKEDVHLKSVLYIDENGRCLPLYPSMCSIQNC